ncbi:metallophosphoesterase [Streptococcus gordonii]|uniref:Ser/Thr protein phosphatase family n=2 Tax=Streptococcus gordonii TaxID=1302 RepID=A8AY62_STRGC|nr:metallophosphoesterase [Streptococcus gordonii]ABV10449.1 Ser/Thr protein phosphatase family [Streptococcus gordonii str. Challis substr. CH1]KJQ63310.1 Calcineurin-like phosphoesterase [Streptococcus gordonii]MBZ2137150.1 metallophosphoesterase [Streptococcus gordonii]QGS43776.1 phosphoesterase [Streptococcus gordonii]RSJ46148.1 Calcineurin-like phosphoesterase [Streptococcus gordonii]
MTRIGFMSDLHLDSNQFGHFELETLTDVLKKERIDHLHIAGDLSNDLIHISLPFIEDLRQEIPTSFNLGNHDMLGLSEQEISGYDFQIQQFGQTKLVSFSGWYDYSFVPEKSKEEHLRTKNNFWFDRRLDRELDDPSLTAHSLLQLKKLLASLDGPIIIALHFVPHQDFLYDHPYFQRFNAFLGSQAFHQLFVKYEVTDVVFGHLHHRHHIRVIDGVRYHMRPLGYIREWKLTQNFFNDFPQHKISQMYRLHKRYNTVKDLEEFLNYKKKHLADELRDALTILDTKS